MMIVQDQKFAYLGFQFRFLLLFIWVVKGFRNDRSYLVTFFGGVVGIPEEYNHGGTNLAEVFEFAAVFVLLQTVAEM